MFKFLLTGCVKIICKVSLQNLFSPFPYVIKKLNLPKSYNCKFVRAKIITGKSTQNSEDIGSIKIRFLTWREGYGYSGNFNSLRPIFWVMQKKLNPPLPSRNRVNCLLETVLSMFRFHKNMYSAQKITKNIFCFENIENYSHTLPPPSP